MILKARKLLAAWALGPVRFLELLLYLVVSRLLSAIPAWPEEARTFVVGTVDAGGQVARSSDLPATVRVEQRLDEIQAPLTAFVRPGTSDLAVWNQVVHERHYAPIVSVLRDLTCLEVGTILDLGANIGLTASYLGGVFPRARILAVEPDAENFRLLERNTQLLGDRVHALQAAFWPRAEPLRWTAERFRDGRGWARAVEAAGNGASSIAVTTPSEALACLEVERVDLAKIDIEGAEAAFFAAREDTDALLGLADVFAIELHPESVDPLETAIAFERGGFLTLPAGGFVIAIRRERIRTFLESDDTLHRGPGARRT